MLTRKRANWHSAFAVCAVWMGGLWAEQPAIGQAEAPRDPLPSWNEGPAKQAISAFVARVTRSGRDFLPPAERIAVFDNDGTLWSEQPVM